MAKCLTSLSLNLSREKAGALCSPRLWDLVLPQSLTSPTDFMEPGRLQLPSKAAPALADPQAEVFPFSYNYAVNDDYSGSAFPASESDNKLGARSVTYSTDDIIGYVAELSYEGAPTYPQTTAVVAQPAVSVARSPLGESTSTGYFLSSLICVS